MCHSIMNAGLLQLDVLLHESASGAEARQAEFLLTGLLDTIFLSYLSPERSMNDTVTTQRTVGEQGIVHTRLVVIVS